MQSDNSNGSWVEKREYPRISANCPVRYKIGPEKTWQEAILIEYSATGARIQCEELILKGTRMFLEVLPGLTKNIPPFTAEAVAIRFALDDEHRFQVGCEFHKPITSLMSKASN